MILFPLARDDAEECEAAVVRALGTATWMEMMVAQHAKMEVGSGMHEDMTNNRVQALGRQALRAEGRSPVLRPRGE